MIVLHVANITGDKSQGPNINVPKNILYGSKVGNVGLFNLSGNELAINIPKSIAFSSVEYNDINNLPSPYNKPDIVIFQGLYFIEYCYIAKWLRKNGIPYIIVPRCSMTAAAAKKHFLRKRVGNILFFKKFVKNAESIQFLTNNEYLESRKNFNFKSYYILGNGVELPDKRYAVKKRRDFKIVYIGRYNVYHKGLDILLEAVKKNIDWFRTNFVTIELYGRDSQGGLSFLTKYVKENHIEDIVHIHDSVFDEKKEKVLLDADIFIHTSRLEGQPTSVIEAFSYGLPVIVTPGTNMTDVVDKNKLGFTTELNSKAVFACIRKSFLSKNELSVISKKELLYAKNNFDWKEIVGRSLDKYSQLAGVIR